MKNEKRILFLADINSVHTERWVKSLVDRGFQINLFSLTAPKTDWMNNCRNFEFKCFGIDQATVQSNSRFGKFSYFKARKEAKAYFQETQPDIVHAHYASSYGMLARTIGFEKTVLSLWGSDVYEFPKRSILHRKLFKRAVSFPAIVCSTSKDMAKEAWRWIDRSYVITPFGVDTDRFSASSKKSGILTLGTVKSLEEVYGIDRLIQLYADFRATASIDSQLVIYGKGSQEPELRSLVKGLNLEDHVQFKGFVSQDKLVAAFQSLDIFMALSRRESFGVAALEAQSCGVPVLVTSVGGLPEVVDPESGVIVAEDKPENWLHGLNQLMDKVQMKTIGDAPRNFVIENFSHDVCVDKIIQVYEDVERV